MTGARAVAVTAADGTVDTYLAAHAVVIGTGTGSAVPPIPGLCESAPWDNRDVTALKQVPLRLLVLGGGGRQPTGSVAATPPSDTCAVQVPPSQ